MSDQLLDQLVDRAAYTSDKEFVEGILSDIFKDFKKVDSMKIKLSTDGSFQAVNTTVKEVKKSQDELSLSVKAYQTVLDTTAKNQAKFNANTSESAKTAATAKVALQQQNAELVANAKVQAAANQSVGEARAVLNALKIQRDAVTISDEASKKKVQELNQAIDQQNKFINENTSDIEKQKNNVGNYIGAINILKPSLESAAASLAEMTKNGQTSGEAYESLQKEVGLLTVIIDKQEAGFSSLNRELRANREALQTMRAAGLAGTEAFKALSKQVNKAQDDFDDFREAQALLGKGGEAPILALTKAAEGLVSVYGAAVSAEALFGEENENLTKAMVKLQAALTLLTSVQQISKTIGEREAIVAGLQAGARRALAAATEVYTFVTEGATLATQAFRAALLATGLGAVIALVVAFVVAMKDVIATNIKFLDGQIKINNSLKDFYDQLKDTISAVISYNTETKKGLEDRLALMQAEGAGFRELQAIKQRIAEEDVRASTDGLKQLKLTERGIEDLQEKYDGYASTLTNLQDVRRKLIEDDIKNKRKPEDDAGIQALEKEIELQKSQQAAVGSRLDAGRKLLDQGKEGARMLEILAAETKKYNDEQQANERLNIVKTQLDRTIAANQAIVADERKTQADRTEAIRQGARDQAALEAANLARAQAVPGQSKEERAINARNAAAAIQKIEIDAAKQELDLKRAYDEQEYQYRLSVNKQLADDAIAKNQVILDDEKSTLDQRLAANADNYNKRRGIAAADYFNTLHDQTTTEEQRKAATAKFNSDVLAADIQFHQTRFSIQKEDSEKIFNNAIAANEKQIAEIKSRYAQAQIALNEQREKGLISDAKYARLRLDQDEKFADEELQVDITTAYFKVNATKEGTKARADAEQELYDKIAKLTDNQVKHTQDAEKKKQEAVVKTVNVISQIYDDITNVIGKALDNQITNQKNAIQKQLDAVSIKKQADIDAENATLDSAQVKADKIAVIEAKAQADSEALQLRQKKLDIEKAKFDKIKAIGSIILDTAKAVAADLTNPAKIPFDIALGAAELAIAIAAPIPTYAHGIFGDESHPGGFAIVGDGGRSELVELPDGSMYVTPSHNTLVDMPEGSHVYPDAQKILAGIRGSIVYSQGSSDNGLSKIIVQQTNRTIKAIKDKEELHINPNFSSIMAIHKYGNSYVQRVADRVQF